MEKNVKFTLLIDRNKYLLCKNCLIIDCKMDIMGNETCKKLSTEETLSFCIFVQRVWRTATFLQWNSNIPASPAYGVYISQLIRYARASSNYSDFLKLHLHLRNRLLDQGYKKIRLIRSLKKFIFRYQDLVEIYSVSAETIISDAFSYSENV